MHPLRQLLARVSQDARAVASLAQGHPDRAAYKDRQETFATRPRAAGLYALRGSGMFDWLSDGFDLSCSAGPYRHRSTYVYRLFRLRDAVSVRRDHDGAARCATGVEWFRFEAEQGFQSSE